MEYVVVHFAERRPVLLDDDPLGSTEDTLEVEEGHHTFTLDGPLNFFPDSIDVAVTDTSALDPLELTFTHMADTTEAPSEPTAPPLSFEPKAPNV